MANCGTALSRATFSRLVGVRVGEDSGQKEGLELIREAARGPEASLTIRSIVEGASSRSLEAEVGIGHAQPAHGLEEGIGRAGLAHARGASGARAVTALVAALSHGLANV